MYFGIEIQNLMQVKYIMVQNYISLHNFAKIKFVMLHLEISNEFLVHNVGYSVWTGQFHMYISDDRLEHFLELFERLVKFVPKVKIVHGVCLQVVLCISSWVDDLLLEDLERYPIVLVKGLDLLIYIQNGLR